MSFSYRGNDYVLLGVNHSGGFAVIAKEGLAQIDSFHQGCQGTWLSFLSLFSSLTHLGLHL